MSLEKRNNLNPHKKLNLRSSMRVGQSAVWFLMEFILSFSSSGAYYKAETKCFVILLLSSIFTIFVILLTKLIALFLFQHNLWKSSGYWISQILWFSKWDYHRGSSEVPYGFPFEWRNTREGENFNTFFQEISRV